MCLHPPKSVKTTSAAYRLDSSRTACSASMPTATTTSSRSCTTAPCALAVHSRSAPRGGGAAPHAVQTSTTSGRKLRALPHTALTVGAVPGTAPGDPDLVDRRPAPVAGLATAAVHL